MIYAHWSASEDSTFQLFSLREYSFGWILLSRGIPHEDRSKNEGNRCRRLLRFPAFLNCESQITPIVTKELACIAELFRKLQKLGPKAFNRRVFELFRLAAPYVRYHLKNPIMQ